MLTYSANLFPHNNLKNNVHSLIQSLTEKHFLPAAGNTQARHIHGHTVQTSLQPEHQRMYTSRCLSEPHHQPSARESGQCSETSSSQLLLTHDERRQRPPSAKETEILLQSYDACKNVAADHVSSKSGNLQKEEHNTSKVVEPSVQLQTSNDSLIGQMQKLKHTSWQPSGFKGVGINFGT